MPRDKKQESGLALNSRELASAKAAIAAQLSPGDPDASLLVQAVRYADDDLKMPPRGKLKDEQIGSDHLDQARGARCPPMMARRRRSFVRAASSIWLSGQHWAYQPLRVVSPPECRGVRDGGLPDRRLHSAGYDEPASRHRRAADKRTLIRRVTFDLTGLPPTPAEVDAFLADASPDAYERLVDRLLASPRYGERWGRHWLDVVRYAETLGYEFDYDLHNAWRYRDYVIRAFNADLPYDQFVDRAARRRPAPEPRRHPLDGHNESILATGFFWMARGQADAGRHPPGPGGPHRQPARRARQGVPGADDRLRPLPRPQVRCRSRRATTTRWPATSAARAISRRSSTRRDDWINDSGTCGCRRSSFSKSAASGVGKIWLKQAGRPRRIRLPPHASKATTR